MKIPTRKSILVVADGPSAELLRFQPVPQSVYVIAINHASIWLPRCNAYMTCNPDHRQRFVLNNPRVGVRYFAAVPPDYGSVFSSGDRFGPRERNVSFFTRREGFGINPDPDEINGGDSTWAALGLTHHMGARRVAVVGLDGDDRPRVSGGRPGDLSHLNDLFSSYDGKAKVVNGSPRSQVTCFPRMSAGEAIAWLL